MTGPVSDEALAEIMARGEYEYRRNVLELEWERGKWECLDPHDRERYMRDARRRLAVVRPVIEQQCADRIAAIYDGKREAAERAKSDSRDALGDITWGGIADAYRMSAYIARSHGGKDQKQ